MFYTSRDTIISFEARSKDQGRGNMGEGAGARESSRGEGAGAREQW